ncbi:MAG: hypothetical protein NTX17_06665 [Candidatus Eisenbacteria bacterium]|nr:hypothetical protein [Candidatus Eisenbacteria bacterium]
MCSTLRFPWNCPPFHQAPLYAKNRRERNEFMVLLRLLGGLVMKLATGRGFSFRFNPSSFAVAMIGSIILLAISGLATRGRD